MLFISFINIALLFSLALAIQQWPQKLPKKIYDFYGVTLVSEKFASLRSFKKRELLYAVKKSL